MFTTSRTTRSERDQGFTLIELLVVVVIIGVLAAIAIPVFLNQRQKGVDAGLKSDVRNGANAVEVFSTDNPSSMTLLTMADLEGAGFKLSPGNTVDVTGSPAEGYCVLGWNEEGSDNHTDRGSALRYDSTAGGLNTYGGACTKPTEPLRFAGSPECGYASAPIIVTCSSYSNQSYIDTSAYTVPMPPGTTGQYGEPYYRLTWMTDAGCAGGSSTGNYISTSVGWQAQPTSWYLCRTNEFYCCSFTWVRVGPMVTIPGQSGGAVKP